MSLHDELRALVAESNDAFGQQGTTEVDQAFICTDDVEDILARHPAPTVHDDHAKLAPELMRLLDDLDADSENDNYSKGDAADEIRQALKNACGCERGAPIHSRRCPDAQLQVQAPVGEHLENGVSDGEREAAYRAFVSSDEASRVLSRADWFDAGFAAGYRKAPVVNVEES